MQLVNFFSFNFFPWPTEVANDYSKNLNSNLNEDRLIKIERESTENLSLLSDGEVLTTVDNSSTESAKKSKYFLFVWLFNINFEVKKFIYELN